MFNASDSVWPDRRKSLASRKGRCAFTLVELLVVVAIIALLVSILLPTLGKAKAGAKMVVCQTNLHAIGTASYLYAAENDDYVPRDAWYNCNDPTSLSFGCYSFAAKFSHYMGGPVIPFEYDDDYYYMYDIFKEIPAYMCPSFQDQRYVLTYLTNARDLTKDPPDTETVAAKLTDLSQPPAVIPYICEMNPVVLEPDGDFGRYDFFTDSHTTFDMNGEPNVVYNRMIRFDDERHLGRTTMTFFDGHAENKRLVAEEMPRELFYPEPD